MKGASDHVYDHARNRRVAGGGLDPSPLARLTVEQFEAMVDSGVFTKRDKFHLVNGMLVTKVTKNRPHVIATEETRRNLERIIPPGWHVMTKAPVCLPPKSVPGPGRGVSAGRTEGLYRSPPAG